MLRHTYLIDVFLDANNRDAKKGTTKKRGHDQDNCPTCAKASEAFDNMLSPPAATESQEMMRARELAAIKEALTTIEYWLGQLPINGPDIAAQFKSLGIQGDTSLEHNALSKFLCLMANANLGIMDPLTSVRVFTSTNGITVETPEFQCTSSVPGKVSNFIQELCNGAYPELIRNG